MSGGSGSTAGIKNPLFVLPAPLLVIEPGLVAVSVTNLSSAANSIQLCLHAAQPRFWRPS